MEMLLFVANVFHRYEAKLASQLQVSCMRLLTHPYRLRPHHVFRWISMTVLLVGRWHLL